MPAASKTVAGKRICVCFFIGGGGGVYRIGAGPNNLLASCRRSRVCRRSVYPSISPGASSSLRPTTDLFAVESAEPGVLRCHFEQWSSIESGTAWMRRRGLTSVLADTMRIFRVQTSILCRTQTSIWRLVLRQFPSFL